MSPIPINASMGMVISLAVALVFTPWLCRRLLAARSHQGQAQAAWLQRLFERLLTPFTRSDNGRRNRHWLYGAVAAAIVLAVALVAVQWVVLKMLPFDNKSEFQVVLDMPEGTTLEDTARTLDELAQVIAAVPEVTDYQAYAGTAAPINFNGLVRQYYLRRSPHAGDLQVNLVDKHHRDRSSHEIAAAVRPALAEVGRRHGAVVQVVEVPPGPPVQAPLVAEVYGPSYVAQRERALALRQLFEDTPDIVDVDTSVEAPAQRWTLPVDRQKAALLGVDQAAAVQTAALAVAGRDATYVHTGREHYPIPVRVGLGSGDKASLEPVQELEVRNLAGARVPLSEITRAERQPWDGAIIHKDLSPVVFVTGDMAGRLDSPLYGMFRLVDRIEDEQRFISAPEDPAAFAIKWDGEWQITYETFRDMGLAYSVGLVLIYLLVVAQFRSYVVPLIIMAPIPLTVIGVMPGHALLGAQFTATSMIGMIALAGIIVRNSILLVDFVDAERAAGRDLASAVIRAGAIRARPIALTALAAMAGAFFILDDPIFNGLAVSLIFGILVSTALTLLVIPVLYFALRQRTERRLAARAAVMPGAAAR
jgi:multidrug efflux pump subunit AcrB